MDKPPKEPIERLKRRVEHHSPHRLLRKKLVRGGVTISAEKRRGRLVVRVESMGDKR